MIITLHAHKVLNAKFNSIILTLLVVTISTGLSSSCLAGAFVFAGLDTWGVDTVTHPTGYTGTGGEITIGVCIDPSSPANLGGPSSATLEIALQNIVATYNSLQVTSGNLINDTTIPTNFVDFESVALHEVGHCIGLAHPNIGAISGISNEQKDYTQSTSGADNIFSINNPGTDLVIGSGDDIRGDDVNLHWFRKSDNNPFFIATVVDSTTYSRRLADLPNSLGITFAANGARDVANLLGIPNTEAVMQQGVYRNEAQRTLVADDVATLKYAMSGVDEIAGTADDYTLNMVYRGITTTNCDVVVKFDNNETSLAVCQVRGNSIGTNHIQITSAHIYFNDQTNWYFNDTPIIPDTRPDTFTFIDLTNIRRDSIITSNTINVLDINTDTPISITGGEYSINGGVFTTSPGTVRNNNTVNVRHTSSAETSTITETTLNIGGVSDTFSSTTQTFSVTPDPFTFIDQTDVVPNTLITSNSITVSGINTSATIIVSDGEYSVNGGNFTLSTGLVANGDTVVLRHTSAASLNTTTDTLLTIGETSDTFTSRTVVIDSVPEPFRFIDQTNVTLNTIVTSNRIIVTDIAVPAVISISNGTYSVDGDIYTSASGLVNNGALVDVRHTSSASFSTSTNTTLTIGGISDVFTSTTLADTRSRDSGGSVGFAVLLILFSVLFFRTSYNYAPAVKRRF